MKQLKVHPDGRFLQWENGDPFFYLGDTAWELFHRLSKEEAKHYLSTRAAQGFNVIQAVALAELEGLRSPNAYGRFPLQLKGDVYDPASPDTGDGYDYWQHVDFCVDTAAQLGLFIGLLPAWGCHVNPEWEKNPAIFTPGNATAYAEFIVRRYRDRWNIIWILGGDRALRTQEHRDIIDSMGRTIRRLDPHHLITFHPVGWASSADFVPEKDYIDFHTVQSGHDHGGLNSWTLLERTREKEHKPFMDAEPRYEDHPACFKAEYGFYWDDSDVRQNAYWSLMEGVCGHTYGNHSVWAFKTETSAYWPYPWQEVLRHSGAGQMAHVLKLRMSRPFFELRPAPELAEDDPAKMAHQCAARGERYAFIYSPLGLPIRANLQYLGGKAIKASWFDPRKGESRAFALVPPAQTLFVPPGNGKGCDWVLVLDVLE